MCFPRLWQLSGQMSALQQATSARLSLFAYMSPALHAGVSRSTGHQLSVVHEIPRKQMPAEHLVSAGDRGV